MKKLLMFVLMLAIAGGSVFAQAVQMTEKELKAAKKECAKLAKKAAKEYIKEGWKVNVGAFPLEKQLSEAYLMRMQKDRDKMPLYIIGEAMSPGETYDAALSQATDIAQNNLASKIQSDLTVNINIALGNEQLGKKEATSVAKTFEEGKGIRSQSIGRVIPLVECYRELPNGNTEVRLMYAYSNEEAKKVAKRIMRKEFEKEGVKLSEEQLEEIVNNK